jgi:UDP-glucuronate 4-epimerase
MKILITGSAGFIGFHLSRRLLERGDEVVGLDNLNSYYAISLKKARNSILKKYKNYKFYKGDIKNLDFVQRIFKENSVDKVCHLAAQAGVRYGLTDPFSYVQTNLVGLVNILETMRVFGVKNFIYASSSSVYGSNSKKFFSEKDNTDRPLSLYAATKKSNEVIAYAYHFTYGLRCTGLRFFTVYGPFGRPDMAYFKFMNNICQGKPIEVFNLGKMERDFTYIDDIVSGAMAAIDKSCDWEIFNLGNNRPVQLGRLVERIEKELGQKAIVCYKKNQAGEMPRTAANINRAREKLKFSPQVNLEEGIKKFAEWYKSYYKIKC